MRQVDIGRGEVYARQGRIAALQHVDAEDMLMLSGRRLEQAAAAWRSSSSCPRHCRPAGRAPRPAARRRSGHRQRRPRHTPYGGAEPRWRCGTVSLIAGTRLQARSLINERAARARPRYRCLDRRFDAIETFAEPLCAGGEAEAHIALPARPEGLTRREADLVLASPASCRRRACPSRRRPRRRHRTPLPAEKS